MLQGEILSGLQELQPEHPGTRIFVDQPPIRFALVNHPTFVILTPDCDLLSDYSARQGNSPVDAKIQSQLLQHVQCCEVYEENEIRQPRQLTSELWKRVKQNQDERYHHIPSGKLEGEEEKGHPDLFLDFKQMFSVLTEFLYESIRTHQVKRQGVIPPIWIHSLIQRYFAFHSRVGVPDPSDELRQQPKAGTDP